jgi:hypothetical protein
MGSRISIRYYRMSIKIGCFIAFVHFGSVEGFAFITSDSVIHNKP